MSNRPRVLVVDDDQALATNLALILNKTGFEAVPAFSGSHALKLANAGRFDVLLTDVVMSPMDGVQMAIAFRNINPASHIFLFTAAYALAQRLLVKANLAWDFHILSKPIDPAQLIDALRSVESV